MAAAVTTTGACLCCPFYQHDAELFRCELAPAVMAALTKSHYITASGGRIFSQPSIYIDGCIWHEHDVCNAPVSVTFRYCLKTIPHSIILSSRHESDIPSVPGRQVSSS